jgi:uncharacterized protein
MARKSLKRFFPSPEKIKNHPALRAFAHVLHDPNLFHLNRRSVSVAFFWGIFISMIPTPGQMPMAAAAALFFRCNLPISVALVWITNPLTIPFFLVITYNIGAFILQSEPLSLHPEFSLEWISSSIERIWKPLLLGSLIAGIVFGGIGYISMQIYWRLHVTHAWNKRKKKRLAQQKTPK